VYSVNVAAMLNMSQYFHYSHDNKDQVVKRCVCAFIIYFSAAESLIRNIKLSLVLLLLLLLLFSAMV